MTNFVWNLDHELFGMKGNIKCPNGKIISFKNIIARGSGGPIFCSETKRDDDDDDIKVDVTYTKIRQLLNIGMDINSGLILDLKQISNIEELYHIYIIGITTFFDYFF